MPATSILSTSLPTVVNTAGSALSFNGVNDYAVTPNLQNTFASTTSSTIELWFKANGPGVIVSELGQAAINSGWHASQIEISRSGQVQARVWNVARSTAGIQSDMSQPPAVNATGLVLSWQLDDGSGLTAADQTGNYPGSLGGGNAANAPAWVTSNAPVNGVVTTGVADTQTA